MPYPYGMSRVEMWKDATVEQHLRYLDNDFDKLDAEIVRRLDIIEARSKLMLTTFITLLVAVIGAISVLLLTR